MLLENRGIFRRSTRDQFLAVVENVDIGGEARRIPIERRTTSNIAFRIAM